MSNLFFWFNLVLVCFFLSGVRVKLALTVIGYKWSVEDPPNNLYIHAILMQINCHLTIKKFQRSFKFDPNILAYQYSMVSFILDYKKNIIVCNLSRSSQYMMVYIYVIKLLNDWLINCKSLPKHCSIKAITMLFSKLPSGVSNMLINVDRNW